MQTIHDSFIHHCVRPHLGSELAPELRKAGLTVESIQPNSICNTELDPNTFANRLMESQREYVVDAGLMGEAEATASIEDLRELDEQDGTSFNLTQYLYLIRNRPRSPNFP